MKNIEKYYEEIKHKYQASNILNPSCSVFKIRTGIDDCSGCHCKECCIKSFEWLNQEYKEEILSDDEKEIVKEMCDVIHKFGFEVNYVYKSECRNGDCFIRTTFKNIVTGSLELMDSPYFNNDMFKGMKLNKEYKLEELGITCQTQKDN